MDDRFAPDHIWSNGIFCVFFVVGFCVVVFFVVVVVVFLGGGSLSLCLACIVAIKAGKKSDLSSRKYVLDIRTYKFLVATGNSS